MSTCILQFKFKITVPAAEYEAAARSLAPAFAEVPGLVWKIWLLDEPAGEAGGIYLFKDEASRDAFLRSDLAAQVKVAPILRDLEAKQYDIIPSVTETTRGPVQELLPA